eukprot:scaffold1519_cov99-Isochrysis_galbana.AAC.2
MRVHRRCPGPKLLLRSSYRPRRAAAARLGRTARGDERRDAGRHGVRRRGSHHAHRRLEVGATQAPVQQRPEGRVAGAPRQSDAGRLLRRAAQAAGFNAESGGGVVLSARLAAAARLLGCGRHVRPAKRVERAAQQSQPQRQTAGAVGALSHGGSTRAAAWPQDGGSRIGHRGQQPPDSHQLQCSRVERPCRHAATRRRIRHPGQQPEATGCRVCLRGGLAAGAEREELCEDCAVCQLARSAGARPDGRGGARRD